MKKKITVILSLIFIFGLAACSSDNVSFESADEAYEAMTGAVEEGDYGAAIDYYNSGAADSGKTDVASQYFYAVAMNDYEKKGCLGYPMDIMSNKCSDLFTPAKTSFGDLQTYTRILDGIYQCGSYYYLYCADGKIAIGDGGQLTGYVYCNEELVIKDGKYYWAEHNAEGEDTLLYEIEITDVGVKLTAVDENNDMYSGEYSLFTGEMPVLIY